jgi:glycogen debranching enzyme
MVSNMASPGFVREGNLGNGSYFLANDSCFFHRFADSGFRNKWTGFWSDETKFLEYFCAKVGGEFLSSSNCRKLEYNGAKAVHTYLLKGNRVRETAFIPEGGRALVLELVLKKAAEVEIEPAINIRRRAENVTSRKYQIKKTREGFLMANSLEKLEIRVLEGKAEIIRNTAYRTHYPSGEEENCVVPGTIKVSGRRIVLAVSAGRMQDFGFRQELAKKERVYAALAKGKIKSNNQELVRGFGWSILGLELLRKKMGSISCYYAGLPWFQQFWGRDMFWVIRSLLSLGYDSQVRGILKAFAERMDRGRIPNFVSFREKSAWNSIDASLLWIIAMKDYVFRTGDRRFLQEMRSSLEKVMIHVLDRDIDNDGFIEHDMEASETWMDRLRRGEKAVEVQALYFKALCALEDLFMLLKADKHLLTF